MTPMRSDGDVAAELQAILQEAAGLSPVVDMEEIFPERRNLTSTSGYPRLARVNATDIPSYSYAAGADTRAYQAITGNENSANIGIGDQLIRFDNNELSFEDADLKITLKEILEMRDKIKKLQEEIEELKQWKEV